MEWSGGNAGPIILQACLLSRLWSVKGGPGHPLSLRLLVELQVMEGPSHGALHTCNDSFKIWQMNLVPSALGP